MIERVLAIASRVHIPLLASALTFDALLALIPLGVLALEFLNLVGGVVAGEAGDPQRLVVSLLPQHLHVNGPMDPFRLVEGLLTTVQGYSSRFTWVAVPVFLWFASRLFASLRSCLSQVFNVRRPSRHAKVVLDMVLGFTYGKVRDFGMIGVLLVLASLNGVLSFAVVLFTEDTVYLTPPLSILASTLGRLFAELVMVGSAFALFLLVYRYASPKRMAWRGSMVAASVATVGFELAKRLYGLYLSGWSGGRVFSVDAGVGAVILFLLWVYWVAMVFLIGAAAAMVWEAGRPAAGQIQQP
jgi:membrane protein